MNLKSIIEQFESLLPLLKGVAEGVETVSGNAALVPVTEVVTTAVESTVHGVVDAISAFTDHHATVSQAVNDLQSSAVHWATVANASPANIDHINSVGSIAGAALVGILQAHNQATATAHAVQPVAVGTGSHVDTIVK